MSSSFQVASSKCKSSRLMQSTKSSFRKKGVTIRGVPAVHGLDGAVGFILECFLPAVLLVLANEIYETDYEPLFQGDAPAP
jgi:hypothetical protein